MEELQVLFVNNDINGQKLSEMTDALLIAYGVEALGHRKRILRNIRELKDEQCLFL